MKVSRVIDYIDEECIVTKDGEYYKRCTDSKGNNTILCPDNKDYHYESFMYNGNYEQFTVSEISKDKFLIVVL